MSDDHEDKGKEPDEAPEPSAETAETPQVLSVGSPGGRRKFLQSLSTAAAAGAGATLASSCDKSTENSGTSPSGTSTASTTSTAATFTLSGVVTDQSGRPVVGATVRVLDGPNAGKSATTDGNGYYSIPGLVSGGFTLQTTLNGVVLYNQPVTLLRDTRLDYRVTTTSTTAPTTARTTARTTSNPTTSTGGGGTIHYWYPN